MNVCMVERTLEIKIHLFIIKDRNVEALATNLVKAVNERSQIYSDCWRASRM